MFSTPDFSKILERNFPKNLEIKDSAVYIHIPFCLKKCDYCDFYSEVPSVNKKVFCLSKNADIIIPDEYINLLINETLALKDFFGIKTFSTIYIGGGTPSLLSSDQVKKLVSNIISLSESIPEEITIEANPQDLTEKWLKEIQSIGINRLSLGIQTFSDNCFSKIGRRGSGRENIDALSLVEKLWNGRLSCDLISGLPELSEEEFFESLNILTSHPKVDHISMYSLCIEEGTPLFRKIDEGTLEYDNDFSDEMWIKGRTFLEEKGFHQYEVSNFSKTNYESRHNIAYWNQKNYLGIGCGGCGTVYSFNKEGKFSGFRFTGKKIIDYTSDSFFDIEKLDSDICEFEFLMMGFRTLRGISEKTYKKRFGRDLEQRLNCDTDFQELLQNGDACITKIELSDGTQDRLFSLSQSGILFLNNFLEKL